MSISRRRFMGNAAGAALAMQLGSLKSAHASLQIGTAKIDVVSDGSLTLPGSFIFDPMPKDELAPILEKHPQFRHSTRLSSSPRRGP